MATILALGLGTLVGLTAVLPSAAAAAPPRTCGTVLSTTTNKIALLGLPPSGSTGAATYDGGYLAPARAAEWTDYAVEGVATTTSTLAVSFRQSGNNGPSLQFATGQNTLGPLRLNNGGWAADGTIALPAGTLSPGTPFRFRIAVSGQQVTVSIDGTQMAQYSRPWIPASGTIGIRVSGGETGTLDDLVVRRLGDGPYLYADDFDARPTGAAAAAAAGYSGLELVEVCTVPDSPDDAYWIWTSDAASLNNWAAFRKTFTVDDVDALPASVNSRISAETKYWLYVNDELVVFEGGVRRGPNRFDSYVDNVDLRPHLVDGENTIAVLAVSYGRGGSAGPYSGKAGLFFEADDLDLRSNDTWKALKLDAYGRMAVDTNHRLAEPNVRYDARSEIPGWDGWRTADLDDAEWPTAIESGNEGSAPWNLLVDRPIPLLTYDEQPTAIPVSDPRVTASTAGGVTTYQYRLPVNHQLTPYVKLGAGTQAGLSIGLKTDRATVRGAGLEQAVQAQYVTKAGAQAYESLIWMNGDKLVVTAPQGAEVEAIGYRLSGYASEFDGSFTSDDPYLDKLWRMARDTLYVTMRDSYLDSPDRERSQWWGGATNELEEAFYALDPAAADLARKGISNLMGFRNGDLIPSQAPAASFSELPAQSLAAVMSFWRYYEYSGDASALEETYLPSVAYLRTYTMGPDGLLAHDHGGTWHWHDQGYHEDGRLIDTLWYYIALESTMKSGLETGVAADDPAILWMKERAESIRDNLDKLWVPGKGYYESTGDGRADDRANALAVYAGLATPSQYEQIRDVLVNIQKSSPYMDKYVLEALYLMGYPEDAVARMKDRYAPMVDDPDHSTLWEFFAGPEQDAAGTFNHASTGGPLTMMSRYAAGIQQVEPGFAEFAVRPQLGGLKTISATVHGSGGQIAVDIDARNRELYELDVLVPTGTIAQVHLPTVVVGDVTLSGAPLGESTPGVLDLTVDEAAGETVVRVEAGQHAFDVLPAPAAIGLPGAGTVAPGGRVESAVRVENTGRSRIDTITAQVEVPGLAEPITLTGGPLAAGGSTQLPFTLVVPQGARHGTSYDASAEVTVAYGEQQERSFHAEVSGFLRVASAVTVDAVTLGERVGDYPRTGRWTVTATVRNEGTTPVTGQLAARSVEHVLEAGAPSQLVTIPAGESRELDVVVHGGGRYWLPMMQSVTVDFADRGAVLGTATSSRRLTWYGPKGQGWNSTGAAAITGARDFVDFGDGGTGSTGNGAANVRPGPTELAHNLRWNLRPTIPVGGTNTEGGLTRRFTWSRDGSWFSVDVGVTPGEPFVLSMRETVDTAGANLPTVQTRPKNYQILVDDVLVRQVRYLMPNEGVVGNTLANYQVLVDDPAALDVDGDGEVTVKYLYRGGDDAFFDPSLTDLWVSDPAEAPVDELAPTVSAAPADTTSYGDNGWITAPTTLAVTAVDDLDPAPAIRAALGDAPLAPYTGPVPVTTDGTHVLSYTATDASSNSTEEQTLTVKVDTTRPTTSFGSFPTGSIREGEVPDEPACTGSDATSGVGLCTQTGYSTAPGAHTLTRTVVDRAGHRTRATLDYVVVASDRAALGRALDAAEALAADDYTTSTWAALTGAIAGEDGARALFEGVGFTQAQVDAATEAVEDAVAALARRGDATALGTVLDAARTVATDLGGYTEESAHAVREALAAAEETYAARTDRTQVQLDDAVSSLQTALDGLTLTPPAAANPAVLRSVYDAARKLSNAGGRYTAVSWARLQRELADARRVLDSASATQQQIDRAAAELTAAVKGLVRVPDVVTRVKLNQSQLRLVRGRSMRLEEGVYSTVSRPSYSGAVVWRSSNPKVATVNRAGVVKARRTGAVTITATSRRAGASGKRVSAKVRVRVVRSASRVKVRKVSAAVPRSVRVGESVFVTGRYRPAAATGVKVTYRSSAPAVAGIDAAGRILATRKGTAKIVVRAGGRSRTYTLTVS